MAQAGPGPTPSPSPPGRAGRAGRAELPRELPAALLWVDPPAAAEPAPAGAVHVGEGLLAVLPEAGDPAVLDIAARLAHQLTQRAEGGPEGPAEGVLVFSGGVRLGPAGLAPVPDPLLAALVHRRPRLPPRGVVLTARAAQGLEEGFRLTPAGGFDAADGQHFPLLALGSERTAPVPFRNPEVLERRLAWVPRPEAEELRLTFAEAPVVRLVGPLGCGKSRLAWESLRGARGRILWSSSSSRRGGGPGHLAQIGRQLETMTRQPVAGGRETVAALGRLAGGVAVWVVADGLESAADADWEWLSGLAGAPAGGGSLRLLLVGRTGTPWPAPLAATPLVRLGPLAGAAEERLARQAFAGLSLPDSLAERLRGEAAGSPFALEELLVHLARGHRLRRVVGSFFFGGEEGVEVAPSPRLVGHVEAELARLGEPGPLRLLAACDEALPDDLLAAAAAGLALPAGPRWAESYLASGWLADRPGPWGEGVDLTAPVWRAAVAATLPPESRLAARRAVGTRLVAAGRPGSPWATYRLLAGSLAGARELVTVVRGPHADVPRGELFDALRAEAAGVEGLGEGEELERELLWALLPLGRRLGRLGELVPELDRAQELVADRPERFVAIATVRAELAQNAGRPEEAEALLRRALAASREGKEADGRRQALLVLELGRVLQRQGRRREARELLERTLPALDGAARKGLAAQCRFLLGNLALQEHRLPDAERLHRAALEARRESRGPVAGTVASLSALAAVRTAVGDFFQAVSLYREADELARRDGGEEDSFVLLGLGRALARIGDPASASAPLRRALALRAGRDDRAGEAIARLAVAENHLQLGQLVEAEREARKAHFDLSLLPEGPSLADAEQLLGRLHLARRRPADAERHLTEAARIHRVAGQEIAFARDLAALLEAALATGSATDVRRLARELEEQLARFGPRRPADEPFDLHLYRAAAWRRAHGEPEIDPQPWLQRAYEQLLEQTSYLAPADRHHFLLGLPLHREIVEAAAREGLATQGGTRAG